MGPPWGAYNRKQTLCFTVRRNTEIIPRPEGGGGDIGAPTCRYAQVLHGHRFG